MCEVRFTEWTADGGFRHPAFLGLRVDKPPLMCRREVAEARNARVVDAAAADGAATAQRQRARIADRNVK